MCVLNTNPADHVHLLLECTKHKLTALFTLALHAYTECKMCCHSTGLVFQEIQLSCVYSKRQAGQVAP